MRRNRLATERVEQACVSVSGRLERTPVIATPISCNRSLALTLSGIRIVYSDGWIRTETIAVPTTLLILGPSFPWEQHTDSRRTTVAPDGYLGF